MIHKAADEKLEMEDHISQLEHQEKSNKKVFSDKLREIEYALEESEKEKTMLENQIDVRESNLKQEHAKALQLEEEKHAEALEKTTIKFEREIRELKQDMSRLEAESAEKTDEVNSIKVQIDQLSEENI